MSTLAALVNQDVVNAIGNFCLSKGVLAINAGSAATIKTTNALNYSVGGVLYTKSALSAQSFAATHRPDGSAVTTANPQYVQPASTTVIYVVALNANGDVAVIQGSYAGQALTYVGTPSKTVTQTGGVPALPAGYVPIGAVKVATATATTFTPGTTALDAAGITATYFDLALLPITL